MNLRLMRAINKYDVYHGIDFYRQAEERSIT